MTSGKIQGELFKSYFECDNVGGTELPERLQQNITTQWLLRRQLLIHRKLQRFQTGTDPYSVNKRVERIKEDTLECGNSQHAS